MNAEKTLTILIRLNAAALMMAIPTIFLPVSTMNLVHGWLGLGEFPNQPIAVYLAHSTSLLYSMHGIILLLVSIRLREYWSLVGPLMLLHVLLGAMMLFIDLSSGMPWYWTAAEGGPIMAFGAVLFFLWRKASSDQSASHSS